MQCNTKWRRQRRRTVKNNNRCNKRKKICTCSTLFLYISLPLSCMTTTWNFQKLLNYTFHGENCRTFPCSLFFFTSAHDHLALVAASISHFLTAAIKSDLYVVLPTKKCLLSFFISRFRSLPPFFSLSLAGLQRTFYFFSVFFLLYIPNLWTWQLI